uniref:Uncharacterized protein n=1 Tax=Populus trichocarpa TaxID=3694 RepID=A0A3N7FBM3_POPTR
MDSSQDKTMIGTGDHPIPEAGSIEETMSFEIRNDQRRYYPIIEVEGLGGEIPKIFAINVRDCY